mgnify:CR=1 FL=1
MSQQQRENMGTFPVEGTHKRISGKESKPSAGDFKSGAILPKLPGHEPIDDGGVKAPGFQDLRNSTIRRGSI